MDDPRSVGVELPQPLMVMAAHNDPSDAKTDSQPSSDDHCRQSGSVSLPVRPCHVIAESVFSAVMSQQNANPCPNCDRVTRRNAELEAGLTSETG